MNVGSWLRLLNRWPVQTSQPITSAPSTLTMPWFQKMALARSLKCSRNARRLGDNRLGLPLSQWLQLRHRQDRRAWSPTEGEVSSLHYPRATCSVTHVDLREPDAKLGRVAFPFVPCL
ncbi:hypothetical protein E2320_012549, partial [Naja naja]